VELLYELELRFVIYTAIGRASFEVKVDPNAHG